MKTKTRIKLQTSENPGLTLPGLKLSQTEEFHIYPERWIYFFFGHPFFHPIRHGLNRPLLI